jgi:hypothetical protein
VGRAGRLFGRHGARKINTIAVSAIALILAGCGSGHDIVVTVTAQPRPVPARPVAAPPAASSSLAPASDPGGPLSEVGTITQLDKETSFQSDLKLGPLRYGTANAPPPVVAAACNAGTASTLATSAYIRGQITLSYTKGTVPTGAAIDPNDVVRGIGDIGLQALLALEVDGQWVCNPASFSWTFQPGQTATYDAWFILLDARSNAQPTVPQSGLNGFVFNIVPSLDQIGFDGARVVTSGPDAAVCTSLGGDSDALLPFAELPFKTQLGNTFLSCRPRAA